MYRGALQVVVAVGGILKIYSLDESTNKFQVSDVHKDTYSALAYAPNLGRRYDLIAAGTQGEVRIFKVDGGVGLMQSLGVGGEVVRVEWNVTGSLVLGLTNEGIKVWKCDVSGVFKEVKSMGVGKGVQMV